MSGSTFSEKENPTGCGHMPFSKQLDLLLDKYEVEYEIKNPEMKENKLKATQSDEEDMKLWEMAKSVRKHNQSYRAIAKILRELQSEQRNQFALLNGLKEINGHPVKNIHVYGSDYATTSCSSIEDHNNNIIDNEKEPILPNYEKTKEKTTEQMTKGNTIQIESNTKTDTEESVMVAKQTTTVVEETLLPSIVSSKSKLLKTTTVTISPVKNSKLPSLATESKIPKFIQKEVIDQEKLKGRVLLSEVQLQNQIDSSPSNSPTTSKEDFCEDDDDKHAGTLIWELLDHSKAAVRKFLNLDEQEPEQEQEALYFNTSVEEPSKESDVTSDDCENYFLNYERQDKFEVKTKTVMGIPYIPGFREFPKPSYMTTVDAVQNQNQKSQK